jgi:hypothetical protein
MNRTSRQLDIDRALIEALYLVPSGHMLRDAALRADVSRVVQPRPSTLELDDSIEHADRERRILGVPGEIGMEWQITRVGRAWRAENR